MRVYHFLDADHAKEDIRFRRLKLAKIEELNDPFDLLAFSSSQQTARKAIEMTRTAIASSVGLLCFSRIWSNPVQWSHYADGHRGVCLGFDVPNNLLEAVRYRKMRPILDLQAIKAGGSSAYRVLKTLLTIKFEHWRYEQENRQLVLLNTAVRSKGLLFVPFSPTLALREVIVGHRCNLSRSAVEKLLGKQSSSVETYKARLAFRKFEIVRQRDPRFW